MQASIIFQSQKGNNYLYDANRKGIILIHPILSALIREKQNKTTSTIEIAEYEYYIRKYDFLEYHGWFSNFDQQEHLKGIVTCNRIEQELANLRQLTFEITDTCNLKCKYCGYGEFYEDYDERKCKNMDFLTAKTVIDYLYDSWKSPLNNSFNKDIFISFYGGEPLMNMPLIRQVVDYISTLNLLNRFSFNITTNAILLHKYIEYLVKHDFHLLISLDGDKKHNSYRVDHSGKQTFSRVVQNIQLIKNQYPDYFKKKVRFNAVLHNRNSVRDIKNFYEVEIEKKPMISELNNMGIRKDKIEEFQHLYRNKAEDLMQTEDNIKLEEKMFLESPNYLTLLFFLLKYSSFSYRNYNDLFVSTKKRYKIPTGTCYPFRKKMFVTVNGKILACERIGQQFELGRVEDGVVSLDLDAIAQKYNQYYDKLRHQCSMCYFTETCVQCIFNLNDIENQPICHGFMTKDRFASYLNANLSLLERDKNAYNNIMKVSIE